MSYLRLGSGSLLLVILGGCGQPTTSPAVAPPMSPAIGTVSDTQASAQVQPAKPKRSGPVMLGGEVTGQETADTKVSTESIVAALRPLQVLLGRWNATSRKAKTDQPEWVWDFQSNRDQPALVMTSADGEYLKDARLTFSVPEQKFQLTAVDGKGVTRTYQGDFTEPVEDVPGDDQKLQRTFKLELTEADPATEGELWQVTFAQQENDRYLVEINRKRGEGAFHRIDTIHTQREGTSFAVSSTDYGEKTCIISQGLGTIAVSHEGRTYWVCCTGCQAAFEEDPKRWIARFEEMKAKK